MKKLFYSMFMLAAMLSFTACEDVPAPYDIPNASGGESGDDGDYSAAAGSGTLADPFNTTAILKLASELDADAQSDQEYYFKGKVVSITEQFGTQYGNATFYMSDDGTTKNQFYVYQALYLGNKKYSSGTNIKIGDEVIVLGKVTNFRGNTPETVRGSAYVYSINGETGGNAPAGEAKGTGTQADPFNVAAAIAKCKEIGTDPSTEKYYVKGIAQGNATADASYNNITFDIADTDGGAQFTCYQVAGTDGKPLPSGFTIKKGDEVVVYGPIYNYKGNTPETTGKSEAYIVTVNGKATGEGGGDTPQPSNTSTIDNPYTVAKALETANALSDNETTTENFYIKGKVTRKANTADEIGPNSSKKYKDMNYYISDDGTQSKELYIYRGKYLDGADFTDYEQLKEGDEVIIYGQLQKYIDANNGNAVTPEVKNSKIVKLNGQGGSGGGGTSGGPGTVSGNTITVNAADFGVENGTAMGTQTLSDGTKLVFDGGGNSNAPKYYNSGTNIRMYPKNTVTITASKNISKVVFNVDEYQGVICNASGDISASPGTIAIDGKVVTVSGISNNSTVITNTSSATGTASQIRVISIEITYAN